LIAAILLLATCPAVAVAIPRLLGGEELHRTMLLWFVTCHQMFMAVMQGAWICILPSGTRSNLRPL
jgi:hypothetical protein